MFSIWTKPEVIRWKHIVQHVSVLTTKVSLDVIIFWNIKINMQFVKIIIPKDLILIFRTKAKGRFYNKCLPGACCRSDSNRNIKFATYLLKLCTFVNIHNHGRTIRISCSYTHFHVIASQLTGHHDVINNQLWRHQLNVKWTSETRIRCVNVVVYIVIDEFVMSSKK